jgi:hypothetical protein
MKTKCKFIGGVLDAQTHPVPDDSDTVEYPFYIIPKSCGGTKRTDYYKRTDATTFRFDRTEPPITGRNVSLRYGA